MSGNFYQIQESATLESKCSLLKHLFEWHPGFLTILKKILTSGFDLRQNKIKNSENDCSITYVDDHGYQTKFEEIDHLLICFKCEKIKTDHDQITSNYVQWSSEENCLNLKDNNFKLLTKTCPSDSYNKDYPNAWVCPVDEEYLNYSSLCCNPLYYNKFSKTPHLSVCSTGPILKLEELKYLFQNKILIFPDFFGGIYINFIMKIKDILDVIKSLDPHNNI